jgi:hypothetical protein
MVCYFSDKEHNFCMAASNTPVLSDAQLAELEKLARTQERTGFAAPHRRITPRA